MSKIVVVGASGTVGRQVVDQLLAAGVEVRALARDPERAGLPGAAEVVRADLTEPDTLRAPLAGADAVFLVWPFATAEGLPAVLGVIGEHARRVVYLSSAAQRAGEREAERLIAESGLEWTFLRPHVFAANMSRWAGQIRDTGVLREPYGAAVMAPLHERDLAAVAVRALVGEGHSGVVHTLTGPEALTQAELARVIGEAAGVPVRWEEQPPEAARRSMLGRGWPVEVVEEVLRAQEELVTRPLPVTFTVEEVTGVPARSFRAWASEHAADFRPLMKATRIHEYGDASVIRYEDVPRPVPGAGEVLIRVAATSFNPTEAALRAGYLHSFLPVALPYTLGWDVSGTVVEVGAGAAGFVVGDRVIGRLDQGGGAEYAVAPVGVLAHAPHAVPLADAATIPVAGLTAWQALFEHARIAAGQRVLINGAGGGIGVFAVQLAKHAGATVIATASGRSFGAVHGYGADQIIDYTTTSLADALFDPVDVVINLAPISPEAAAALVPLVRPGGVLISVATPIQPPPGADVTASHMVARNDAAQLAEMVKLIDAGELLVEVAEVRTLSELAEVHRRSEAGRTRGKITLIP